MIEPEVEKRMVEHMNNDHSEAVKLYVEAFSDVAETDSAVLLTIDELGMDIACSVNNNDKQVRIAFEPPLSDAGEARKRLVEMAGEARKILSR